jgi:outer membrane protein assembly factor BamD
LLGFELCVYRPRRFLSFDGPFAMKKSTPALLFALVIFSTGLNACKEEKFSLDSRGAGSLATCQAMGKKNRYEDMINCLEAFKSRAGGAESSATAELAIADAYFLKKDYLVAAEAYNGFIEAHGSHHKVPYAYYKSGLSYFRQTPKSVDRDQSQLDNAIKALGAVVNYYPGSPYANEASEAYKIARHKQAQKHFNIGRFYYRFHEYLAAVPRFEAVVTDFTNMGLDEESFYYLIASLKKTQQTDVAMRYFDVFKQHYPNSPYVKKTAGLF